MSEESIKRRQHLLFYFRAYMRLAIAALPFVFFAWTFERLIRHAISKTSRDMSVLLQGDANIVTSTVMVSEETWILLALLACITILLIVSLLLLGRALNSD